MRTIRRVLMFHGNDICNNTLNIFADSVAEALRGKGIETGYVNLGCQGDELADEYVREINKGVDAAIAFNAYGYQETSMGGENLFDYLGIPFFNWIVDHPCEHTENLISELKNYHVICLDRDHVDYVKRVFPNVAGAHFIPLGGQKADGSVDFSLEAFLKRQYKITFTGSLGDIEKTGDLIRSLPSEYNKAAVSTIERMLDDRTLSYENALRLVMNDMKIDTNPDGFREYAQVLGLANSYVRHYVRDEILQYIAASGLAIDIFGSGWDDLSDLKNVNIHGTVSYAETLNIAADSMISLNVMPLFRNGLHDRIPTSMLNGTAVASDTSVYMNEILNKDGVNAILFDTSCVEGVPGILYEALKNPEELYEIANRGRIFAQSNLTWGNRIDELIQILEIS